MCGGWCWNGNVFEDVVCSIDLDLYSSQHQEGLCLHVYWGGWYFACRMPNNLRCIKAAARAASRTSYSENKRAATRASYIADHDKRPCNFKKTSNHMNECENLAFTHFHTSTRVWTWYTLFQGFPARARIASEQQ